MKAMETKTREGLEKARELLKEQATTSPFHRVTPLYNLACVEALLGDNLEKALEYLQEAVAAGWSDVDHIKKDTDLDRLRSLDSYKALVASLEADSSSDEEIHIDVHLGPDGEAQFAELSREQKRAAKFGKREERRAEKMARRAEKFAKREEARKEREGKSQAAEVTKVDEAKAAAVAATGVTVPEPVPVFSAPPQPVSEPAPVPAPTPVPVPSPAPVPVQAPVVPQPPAVLSGSSSSIDEFQSKLKTLEEMGFPDRRRNITALVLARGDLVAAVQSLLNQ
jgi:hypothetical protein